MSVYYEQGAYRCEIIDHGLSQSSSGNAQIWLRIVVKDSVADPELQLQPYERTVYWTITDKTIDFILEKLDALGFQGQSFRHLDRNNQNHQSFVGITEEFWCKHETYDGKEREKWDLSRGDVQIKPLDESDARKLDAMFGRKLSDRFKGTAKPQAEPAAVATESTNATPADGIPF